MNNYPISLASYSFHGLLYEGKADIFTYLEMIKYHYNVDIADIWTGFLPTLEPDFIKKVRNAMDEKGITLANLCVDGPYLWDNSEEVRAEHKKSMLEYIKAAETLGAKTIRIDFGGSDGYTMPEEAFDYLVKTYKEYCGICYDLGMKIGPENHWGWDRVPAYLKKVKEAVNSPAYCHLFHFTNFFDNSEEGSEIAMSYAMHTHIPANSLPVAKELIYKLKKADYKGTFSVEHHSGKHEAERVEWQLGAVRSLIAELKEEGTNEPLKPSYFDNIFIK
jgi:sugar phosphate isomerase/epimerase